MASARSFVQVGEAISSVTTRSFCCSAAAFEDLLGEADAAGAVHPARADDVVLVERLADGVFAGQLGAAVGVDGVRRVVFVVGSALLAVEHFVRADVEHRGAGFAAGFGDVARALAVHEHRAFGVAFAAGGVGPGGAVDDDVRAGRGDGGAHGAGVGDVEVGVAERGDFVGAQGLLEREAQLSVGAGDEYSHCLFCT